MSELTAASIWNELLAGQWVVVERRDEVAQRILVLRRATQVEQPVQAFTAVEQEVVAMAMRAWSLKMIAAELGLSTSRVAEVLGRVRSKLGAPTHADLLRMVGSFGPPPDGTATNGAPAPEAAANPPIGEKFLPKRRVVGHQGRARSAPAL